MSDIYDNIKAGKYKNQMPFPKPPVKPNTSILGLDSNQMYKYADDLALWEKLYAEYKQLDKEYDAESGRLIDLFYDDMQLELGYDPKCPIAQKLLALAWGKWSFRWIRRRLWRYV